jgi:NHL repeat
MASNVAQGSTRLILIGAAVLLSIGMGLRQSIGLFLTPVTRDLALTAADFTLTIAIQNIVWGLAQAPAGAIADRFGLRVTLVAGTVIYIAGLAATLRCLRVNEGQYPRAHGVHVTPDDTMFLTDDGGHFVRKVTLEGKVLLELGVPGKPAPFMSGEPFHRCTHTALSPQGEIYVSDGYGNSRVHKYSPDGKLLISWGAPGTGEGEFNIVHNICCDADGWVYVADRENHRVQVFDGNGKFEAQWQNLHRPCGLFMPDGHEPIFYVGEVGPAAPVSRDIPNLGPRVSIVDHQGKLIGRFGDTPAGIELGKFLAPHGLAVDSRGDVYVGEVSWTAWPQIYPDTPRPDHIRSIQKFEKVG